ncbi:MAG: preprotein translocase subunit SecE [Magnetococcus sp. YQC-5]
MNAMNSDPGRVAQFKSYLTEVRAEVGKVVWPTRKDTMNTTIVVFGMVVLVSLFLWMVDAILALIVRQIIG